MASFDAKISKVDVLGAFSGVLSEYSSMTHLHSKAFVNMMTEKLSELLLIEKKAREICDQFSAQKKDVFDSYAYTDSNNINERNRLLYILSDLKQKELNAKRKFAVIHQNVNIARSMVLFMIDCTKDYNKRIKGSVENGVLFLNKERTVLEQYKDNKNRINGTAGNVK